MREVALYPLRLDPIYQYRLWGGRRLGHLLSGPFPDDGPIGEAWLLSDRDEHPSRIAEGPLKRSTIGQLMQRSPEQLMGKLAGRFTQGIHPAGRYGQDRGMGCLGSRPRGLHLRRP
jgi:mannose-6-phosphate isomerase